MSSTAPDDSPENSQRRERAVIAAQACSTCRSRKSKCDERRPKCSLCRRLGADCVYREPLPTKKDKTMVHILDALTRLENKFDNIAPSLASVTLSPDNTLSMAANSASRSSASPNKDRNTRPTESPAELQHGYQLLTVPHKIILWPGIYIFLANSGIRATSDLQFLLQEGTSWLIRQEMNSNKHVLPSNLGLVSYPLAGNSPNQFQLAKVAFPDLTASRVKEFCDAYFNTFNALAPILDREVFMTEIMEPAMRDGFSDGDANSVLALLVLSLGQLAIEGVSGPPITSTHGVPSGFRGGTRECPPGIEIFNEARRRVGFVATAPSLENVQVMLLQAAYFEACARHLDFWRSTIAASMAIQVIIKCQNIDWKSHYGSMVKRAYWVCVLSEDLYHLDLDLPKSGIQHLEDQIDLRLFQNNIDLPENSTSLTDDASHYQYYFLAMITLRRLILRINESIHESFEADIGQNDYPSPPVHVVRELARQLESWRMLLPRPLQWDDSDKMGYPNLDRTHNRPRDPLFSTDQGNPPISHRYNLDIVTAQLRTRFYYARFMIFQPFVYKALHFPERMNEEDGNCCAQAMQSVLLWPMSLAPPKDKKRLVPHLFAYTQNFVSILLILRISTENECLRRVCGAFISHEDMQTTAALMLDWIRDVRQLDAIAEWSWGILEPLYA